MLMGLMIYVSGARYLPPDTPRVADPDVSEGSGDVKRQMVLLVSIALVVVVFRGAYEQIGNTFAIWADQGVDRRISVGVTIPMTWFQSLNPMFVFLLTPALVIWWTRAGRRGRDPSPLIKMSIGAALVALAYLLLACVLSVQAGVVSWMWAALFVLLLTAGELFILPTGLALFGQLAPRRFAATVMALWFLGSFGGNLLAGVLGSLWTSLGAGGFFILMGCVAGVAAVLLLAIKVRLTAFPESKPMEFPQARRDSVTGV
jgi:POT family proton-dependent oligopeptide transporter